MTAPDDAPMVGSLIDAFKWVAEAEQWEMLGTVAAGAFPESLDRVANLSDEPTDDQRVALGIAQEITYGLGKSIELSAVAVLRCAAALERIAAALEAK